VEKPSSPESGRRWPFRRSNRPRRLRSIALLPTLITLGNGVCGVIAVFKIGVGLAEHTPHRFHDAAWLILLAMVFDALDGFVARLTKTSSVFGAQLDSLCDLISFGLAPAFLAFAASREILQLSPAWERLVQAVCTLYAICALIRLARFTVETTPDESSHREFAGLPSPGAAGVVASAVLPCTAIGRIMPELGEWITAGIPGLVLACGILMVSRLRYAHVINRFLRGRRPFILLVEIALLVALSVILQDFAFFLAFFIYAVTGPLSWLRRRMSRKPASAAAPSAGSARGEGSA
jgi:CDP-diacylglycerol--serine O-phosphatidyltransferase